jgi:COP9 signalosome complex subunit 1
MCALYATLCALASLDRGEAASPRARQRGVQRRTREHAAAQQLLEDFVASRYASLFARLADLRPRMQLDNVLAPLAAELEATIRQKALKQYFGPYSVVDLSRMAAAFACDVEHLEEELAQLIADDHIQARIDSHNKRLYARQTDERADAFAAVINAGEAYVQNMQAMSAEAQSEQKRAVSASAGASRNGRARSAAQDHA